mmetsp:Transcript_13102/g.52478  ORF Transcript_13102/g.52478 Transcript_13102/m.52478 type:complete len:262 (-) Transcript_13102:1365-2150(-)
MIVVARRRGRRRGGVVDDDGREVEEVGEDAVRARDGRADLGFALSAQRRRRIGGRAPPDVVPQVVRGGRDDAPQALRPDERRVDDRGGVDGGVDPRLDEDDAGLAPRARRGVERRVAVVRPLERLHEVDVRPLEPVAPDARVIQALRHELDGARVALAVVAEEDEAELGVQRGVLGEVARFLQRQRLHVAEDHHLGARLEVADEHGRHGVEPAAVDEVGEPLVRRPLGEVAVDVRPRRQERQVAEPRGAATTGRCRRAAIM